MISRPARESRLPVGSSAKITVGSLTDNGTAGGATLDGDQFVVGDYNAGMRGIKGSEYEGGHRVPLFIHWPADGIDTGRDVPELTANVDKMPTLLELCGIDPGEHASTAMCVLELTDDANPEKMIKKAAITLNCTAAKMVARRSFSHTLEIKKLSPMNA